MQAPNLESIIIDLCSKPFALATHHKEVFARRLEFVAWALVLALPRCTSTHAHPLQFNQPAQIATILGCESVNYFKQSNQLAEFTGLSGRRAGIFATSRGDHWARRISTRFYSQDRSDLRLSVRTGQATRKVILDIVHLKICRSAASDLWQHPDSVEHYCAPSWVQWCWSPPSPPWPKRQREDLLRESRH